MTSLLLNKTLYVLVSVFEQDNFLNFRFDFDFKLFVDKKLALVLVSNYAIHAYRF